MIKVDCNWCDCLVGGLYIVVVGGEIFCFLFVVLMVLEIEFVELLYELIEFI